MTDNTPKEPPLSAWIIVLGLLGGLLTWVTALTTPPQPVTPPVQAQSSDDGAEWFLLYHLTKSNLGK